VGHQEDHGSSDDLEEGLCLEEVALCNRDALEVGLGNWGYQEEVLDCLESLEVYLLEVLVLEDLVAFMPCSGFFSPCCLL